MVHNLLERSDCSECADSHPVIHTCDTEVIHDNLVLTELDSGAVANGKKESPTGAEIAPATYRSLAMVNVSKFPWLEDKEIGSHGHHDLIRYPVTLTTMRSPTR